MEKRDYIWVGIRIFGIFLLVKAVLAVPTFLSSSTQLFISRNWWLIGASNSNDALDDLKRQMFLAFVSQSINSIGQILIYGIVGIYLIRGGRLIFRWILPPENEKGDSHQI